MLSEQEVTSDKLLLLNNAAHESDANLDVVLLQLLPVYLLEFEEHDNRTFLSMLYFIMLIR